MKDFNAKGEIGGVEFHVDNRWRFCVFDRAYDTYKEMCEAIERKEKADEAIARRKVNLSVLTRDGKEVKITGVHAGNGTVITKPKVDLGRHGDTCYPVVPWIAEALEEVAILSRRVAQLRSILRKFSVDTSRDWRFRPGDHSQQIDKLEASHANLLKRANATSLAEQKQEEPLPDSGEIAV